MRTAIALLALAAALTAAGASDASDASPGVPVMGRLPIEVGSVQISIEARFISVEQTDIEEFTFATSRLNEMPPSFEQYLIDGAGQMAFASTTPQLGAPDEGWGDMFWCGTYLWGSWCQWIRAFNTDGSQAGYFWGPENPNRAVLYDGLWWYAARPDGHIWRGQWDGAWGSMFGWINITIDPVPDLTGLAFDSNADALWVTMSNGYVRQYEMDGGPVLAELPLLSEYGRPHACCMSNTAAFGYTLAVLQKSDRSGDWLVFYDVSDTPVETATWGSIKAMFR